jgi:thioredoxin reductase
VVVSEVVMRVYDVVIVGGGPAGLSAALVLGRCRRRVLVCDAGHPRNAASQHLHGFLTRDGTNPLDFLQIAREQLSRYLTVELRHALVRDVRCEASLFHTTLDGGEEIQSRRLLLATGVVDNIPPVEGLKELYGKSVFHCPYCDAWEVSDQIIGVYGRGEKGFGLSLEMTAWSRDLVLLTDGPSELDAEQLERLQRNGVAVKEERVARLEGRDGILERVIFEGGDAMPMRALFFTTGQGQRSHLSESLGCDFNEKGTVSTGKYETTHLKGLYVAGDASRAVQWVIVAAAEGAEAAFSINQSLIKEDLR